MLLNKLQLKGLAKKASISKMVDQDMAKTM